MQSTGHGATQRPQPEHSSGTISTLNRRRITAPNSGGQAVRQASQLTHDERSTRSGDRCQCGCRARAAMRSWRPVVDIGCQGTLPR